MFRNLFLLAAISLWTAAAANAGVEVTENHLTGEKIITLTIPSETKVSNSIGSMESASIVLRCWGKELDGYVWTPTYNGISRYDKATLKIKFYGGFHNVPGVTGKIFEDPTSTSPSGGAFFLPKPKNFVKSLLLHSSFVAAWTPYGRVETSAKWNIEENFEDLLEFGKMCNVVTGNKRAILQSIEARQESSDKD